MCRLFGLSAGQQRVEATFWLLDAPDSMLRQSHHNPDGTGLGTFDADGRPRIEKQPIAAYADDDFASEARTRASSTFVAHVRRSSGTALTDENTHPFAGSFRTGGTEHRCIFAHNGVLGDVLALEDHLGQDMDRVRGDTESERWVALICREIDACGDATRGITAAAEWIAAHLPVISANFILATDDELYALRYPGIHELHLLRRENPASPLAHRSELGTRIESAHLATTGIVVIASEPLGDEDWQEIAPGELVHVSPQLDVTRTRILPSRGPAGHPHHAAPASAPGRSRAPQPPAPDRTDAHEKESMS